MRVTLLMAAALLTCSCRPSPQAREKQPIAKWQRVGSWSGHSGNTQTESFEIGYNLVRIRWRTENEKAASPGTFHVTVNSAVSGRELATAVDQHGAGHDVTYVSVDPHFSYLIIDSSNLDWWVTVEEPALLNPAAPK